MSKPWSLSRTVARQRALALTLLAFSWGGCASDGGEVGPAAGSATRSSQVSVQAQREWADSIIYFVIVDRFADGDSGNNDGVDLSNPGGFHGGDLVGLAEQLDEIASLGATAIWITPVMLQIDFAPWAQGPAETNTGSFEHTAFHGYWAEDFTRLDPRFGTEAELVELVEAAHARGIKVLLDVVYNHSGYGARYEVDPRFAGWIRRTPVDCAADPLTCQVGGLPDFDTDRPDVREHLLSANIGLAERTGLDGFRLDTVKHIDHGFWQVHRERTRAQVGDGFFLLAEVWGGDYRVLDDWFENDEVDAGFDFSFRGSCESWVLGRGRTAALDNYLGRRHRVRDGYHLAHYLSSHDEPMSLHVLGGDKDKFRLCVALQMTSLGIPTIYYGEEVGRGGSVWPTNRKDMPWGSARVRPGRGVARDEALREYYQRLISLRRAHPALWRGEYRKLSTDGDLLVFGREDEASGDAVVVALNRGEEAGTASVPAPRAWGNGAKEALGDSAIEVRDGQLDIEVPARSARIYVAPD